MKKRTLYLLAFFFLSFIIPSFAQVIPVIEVRINNTASANDDYVTTGYVRCDLRLINGASFTANLPVRLRNMPLGTGGQLLFSATGGTSAGSSTLDLVANRNNSFTTFYIRNVAGSNSVRDKDAIIEILDNRAANNAIVLSRKGLMVATTSPIPVTLPQIEMQINSVSTLDDYVTWSPTACRIRLVNYASFPGPVTIALRNMTGNVGNINFANNALAYNSTATSTTLNITLPNTGTWVDFFIAGRFGSPSVRDKDAIIEVVKVGAQTITVQDTVISPGGSDSTVITRDTVVSLRDTLITSTAVRSQVVSGNITRTYVRGTVVRVRDTVITATTTVIPGSGGGVIVTPRTITLADGAVLSREPLMVRIRKNANNITAEERQRFLNALTTLNNTFNGYQVLDAIHSEAAFPEAHSGPAFLTWHRAFNLTYERKLQSVDPSVSLPYWRFDLPAPNIFSRDFLGARATVTTNAFVEFNATDPLIAWNIIGGPGIRRTTSFANNASPTTVSPMINETATLALGTDYTNFRRLEINPHDWAHNTTGSRTGDWLREVGTSVRDPLFFLIHCNADRLWARWQWANNRYDAQNVTTYSPQGTFAGAGTIHIGHYLNDSMWPWNGVIGTYTGTGTVLIGNRPNNAPGGPVPNALSLASPVNIPRPLNMIDYRNNRLLTTINSGMGFSYDDTPFQ